MDLQGVLTRALLLLLFLHLMPPGRPHPLGGPSPAPHSGLSGVQEPPARLPGTVREPQGERAAPEPLRQGRRSEAAGEAGREASAAGLGRRANALHGPPRMRDSGCFGGRMDRIGSFTGLGCNVLKRH